MKALWLTSWYPHRLDKFTGDFIQRHALATALYMSVCVMHVQLVKEKLTDKKEIRLTKQGLLTEEVILLQASRLPFPLNKIFDYYNYLSTYKKHIRKYIAREGKPSITHVHVTLKSGLAALWLKRKEQIPYVITEHWTIYNAPPGNDTIESKSAAFKRSNREILKESAMLLPVSDDLGKNIRRKIYPVNTRRILNAVDTRYFNHQPEKKAQRLLFLHVSVMNKQKNAEGILHAFVRFLKVMPDACLCMVGPADEALLQYAASLQVSREQLIFTGEISYVEVAAYMQKATALLLFSYFENMPCVILEALCCGLPVIATQVGGIAEVVTADNGILLPAGDEEALNHAMLAIAKKELVFDSRSISKKATESYSYETIGQEIVALYEEISQVRNVRHR